MEIFREKIIQRDKELTIDSREVAKMIEKEHAHLLRDIEKYKKHIAEHNQKINESKNGLVNEVKINLVEFFQESYYFDSKREKRKKYNITQKGCEFIANKMTGKKGTIFTARYIDLFHRMKKGIETDVRPMVRPIYRTINSKITIGTKLTYKGVPVLISRQLSELAGADLTLKLGAVKNKVKISGNEVREFKKENTEIPNTLTYIALYYENSIDELTKKVKELQPYEQEIRDYFPVVEAKTGDIDTDFTLKLLDNIKDPRIKERISIKILEKLY